MNGIHISPENINIINNNIDNQLDRIINSSQTTIKIINTLKSELYPKIININHFFN